MNHCRKCSLALIVAVALALWVPVVFAAAPPSAMPDLWLDHGTAPLSDLLNAWAPLWANGPDGDGTWSAISPTGAKAVTSCPSAAFVATPLSATTESCPDDGSVSPRDLSNALPLVSIGAFGGDNAGTADLPIWTSAVVLSVPAASIAASSAPIPDLRSDNPPIPPPDWRNIWAPVSASAPGGSGIWSLASASWTDIYGDAPATMSPRPGFAVFQGTPGTVTVDNSAGAVGVTGMHFAVDGYTLAGDALQLAGSAGSLDNIDVGDGTSTSAVDKAAINNALTGSAGLNKVDFGTLTLTGTNTYTGETDINGGTLALAGNGSITGSSGVVIFGSGTFDISGSANGVTIRNLEDDGTSKASVVLGGKTLTVSSATGDGFSGTISGAGGLTVSGGWLALWRAAYTGLTMIDAGAGLQVGFSGSGASIVGDILDNGTLEFFHNDDVTYGGMISGAGSLIQEGTGKLTLTGANTFSGGTSVFGMKNLTTGQVTTSTLAISSDTNLGASSGAVTLNDGTLETTASLTLTHPIVLNSSGVLGVGGTLQTDAGAVLTVATPISGYVGTLTKTGTGTLVLTADNTYGGGISPATTISAGTLQIGSGGTSGSILNDVVDNGSLVFDRSDAMSFSGTVSGTGSLTQSGAGTLTLMNPITYTGETTITGGSTLALTPGSTLSTFHGITADGTLDLSGTASSFPGSVTPGTTIVQSLSGVGAVLLGGNDLILTDSGSFGGVISGSGNLKLYAGTEVLSGPNTYTGDTQIDGGVLALAGNGSIANSNTVVINGGAALDISGTNSGAKITNLYNGGSVLLGAQTLTLSGSGPTSIYGGVISGTGGVTVSDGTVELAGVNTYTGLTTIDSGANLTLGYEPAGEIVNNGVLNFNSAGDLIYAGTVSGSGSLIQAGVGTLTLTGANTFTGGVEINNGTLLVSGSSNLGATSGGVALNGGTLENTVSFTLTHALTLGSGGTVRTDAGTTLTVPNAIGGAGGLTKEGAGTLVLTGANTYPGGTYISAGILQATAVLPGDTAVGSGGWLDGVLGVGGNLSNAGNVAIHGGDTTVGGNYSNASTGTLAISLGSKLAVTGTATLNGTLEVTGADPGYVANTHTDVLTATGGVIGTFAQLVKDTGVVFTSTTIGYGPNDVYLDTTGLSITVAAAAMGIVDPAAAQAAQRVQSGFESINATMASGGKPASDVLEGAGAIQHSATPAVAQATLTSLSGQLHAASAAMLFDGIDAGSNALSEHFDDLVGGRTNSGAWYGDLGWQGNLQRGGCAGATFRSDGGMAGADVRIGAHGVFGFAVGQSRGFGQLDASWDHGRTWMNSLATYGGVVNGPWYASAQVTSGWYREDMQRMLQLGALMAPVGNASTGRYMEGALEGGRVFHIGGTRVVPFADVRYQSLDLGGFIEQGGLGYGLEGEGRTVGRSQAGLGLRVERGWRLANGMQMAFDGSAGWQHTLHQHGDVFNASFTGFNDWLPVEGIGLSRNTTILRAGVSLWPTRNFGLRLGYMREQDQRERAGSAMLQGTVAF